MEEEWNRASGRPRVQGTEDIGTPLRAVPNQAMCSPHASHRYISGLDIFSLVFGLSRPIPSIHPSIPSHRSSFVSMSSHHRSSLSARISLYQQHLSFSSGCLAASSFLPLLRFTTVTTATHVFHAPHRTLPPIDHRSYRPAHVQLKLFCHITQPHAHISHTGRIRNTS